MEEMVARPSIYSSKLSPALTLKASVGGNEVRLGAAGIALILSPLSFLSIVGTFGPLFDSLFNSVQDPFANSAWRPRWQRNRNPS